MIRPIRRFRSVLRSWTAIALVAAAGAIAAAQVGGPSIGFGTADRTGSLTAPSSFGDDTAGLRASPGALPDDGIPDIIVAPDNGSRVVRLLSGADGSEIASGYPFGPEFTGGVRAAYTDVTGDGVADPILATGIGSGLVRLYDGANLTNLLNGYPFGPTFAGGVFVAAGDVSGDGRADVIVGQGQGGGAVRIYDVADGSLLVSGAPFGAAYTGGVRVAAGDVNGDGRAELIAAQASGGLVSVINGVDQSVLISGFPYGAGFGGGIFVAAGDVNADNHSDVIIAPGTGNGPVIVVDGRTSTVLGTFPVYTPGFAGGVRVAAADLTGDGRADIITAPGGGGLPMLQLFDGATFGLLAQALAYEPAFAGGVFVAASPSSPRLRFTSAATTTFTIGVEGTFSITTAGVPPATSLTHTGALPGGVTFTDNGDGTATLTGNPATGSVGTYSLTFTATNGAGPDATQAFTLEVVDAAPRVTATLPADGAAGVPIDSPLVVTFSEPVNVTSGGFSLQCPPGTPVAITVPTASPATQFTIDPDVDLPATTACSLRIAADQVADADADDPPDTLAADVMVSFTTSACAAITVSPTTLAGGNVSLPYGPVTFTQVGGAAPISWSVTSGTLPPGLTLSASTGVLSGTPTASGAFPFTVTATGASGCTGAVPLTLNIASGPNQPPSFTAGPNQTAAEDGGPQTVAVWATAISPGPPDEAAQTVTFNVTGNTNAALFSVAPALSPTGTLTYTPAPNANGTATITLVLQDNGGTALGGDDTSDPQNFTITVSAVNDAPSFTVGADQTVLENAAAQTVPGWATAISAGPADEAGQTLTFVVTNNTNPALFSAGPAVSPTGELTYTPAANAAGTSTITLTLQDNGGTALGGIDTSAPQTFTITVTGVNSAPSFTVGPNQTIAEDSGAQSVAWATAISPGPADEAAQTVAFNVTGNTNAALFSVAPAVSPTGVLSYTPAANANGSSTITLTLQDNGGTADGGVDTSAPQTFTITVTAVNDAPSFAVGTDQTVTENAGAQTVGGWASALSAGPADEAAQTLTFAVTNNTNPTLFSAGPAVSSTGELTYTPATNTSGTATVTLVLQDNGGTALGGVDTSAPQTFTITVTGVNSAPSFTVGPNQTIAEDSGAQLVSPWATAISAGPPDEAGQVLTFNITGNTNPTLFSAAPVVSPAGVLTYTPAANASGTATITLTLSDDGGTAGGGVDTSPPQSFTITVTGVNDAPSFVAGAGPSSAEDAGAQTVNPWATAISPGPPSEAAQTVTFIVTGNTNPALFSAGPAVSPTGILTYTSAPNAFGTADITLVVQDNGGTAGGGIDTSSPQMFTITVTPVNDPPSLTTPTITYTTVGNTQLHVAGKTLAGLTATTDAGGVLTKSEPSDIDGPVAPAAVPLSAVATPNGTITLDADGSFSYVPNAGFSGVDSFTVQVTDSVTPATVTVNVTVSNRVWYVNNHIDADNPAGGDGRSTNAFETLSDAASASGDNDFIFVFEGDTATTPLTGGIALKNGQKLHGEGVGLTVGAQSLVPAGTRPRITAVGDAVSVLANTANGNRTGVEIRGFNLTSTAGNAVDASSANAATLGVRISENTITGALEGIDINQGSTGTAALAVHDNTIAALGTALDITRTAGAVVITAFDDNAISGNSGAGILVTGPVTFDGTVGDNLDPVNGGTTIIGQSGNGVTGAGLVITGMTGALDFVDFDAFADANAALLVTGTGALTSLTGTRVTVTPGAATLVANAGTAVSLTNLTTDLQVGFLTSANSAGDGVLLSTVVGTFSAPAGSTITNAAGTAFNVSGGAPTVTYAGTITDDVGPLVIIAGTTGGAKTFTGAITDGGDGDGSGISLSGNSGTTTFSGGLTLSTGANAAFAATGGGTVIVTDPVGSAVNTIATTTGTALNVSNTTIGAGGLVFQSIAANGATSGIALSNTGATAGLTVTGTGANDSGGVIQNTTGDAIVLSSTRNVSLSQMRLANSGQSHIDATSVNGLTLNGVDTDLSTQAGIQGTSVTNLTISGGTFDRGGLGNTVCNINGLNFTNLLGTSSVTGATFRRSNTIQFRVNNNTATNFAGTPDTLTVSGTTWSNHNQPVSGGTECFGDHLSVNADTGGNFRLIVDGSSGLNIVNATNDLNGGGTGVQATAGGTNGKMDASITGLKTSNNTAGVVIGNTGTGATVTFNVFGNKTANGTGFSGTGSLALAVSHVSSGGTTTGTIDDNSVAHTAGPGTNAVQVVLEGGGTVTTRVSNNVVSGNVQRAFQGQSRLGTGTLNLTLDNNTFNGTDTTGMALQMVNLETGGSGVGHGNAICLNMLNNDVTFGPSATYLAAYRMLSRGASSCTLQACSFALANFTGDGSNTTDVANWVTNAPKSNTTGGNSVAITATQAFQTIAACPTP